VFVAAVLVLCVGGCDLDKDEFPSSVVDSAYTNGHTLSLNTVDADDAAWEAELVERTNAKRAEYGLGPLRRNGTLDALARGQSVHMYEHDFFDHVNPEGDSAGDRLSYFAGGSWVVRENIWIVEPGRDPQYALDGFVASPPHFEAILSNSNLIGVGMVRRPYGGLPGYRYVTMEFLELR
jgi:uncharacterized protein YkwD